MPHKATVTGGLLDEPYPIRTKGDVNRARVLPMPRGSVRPAAKKAAPAAAPAPPAESEQPQGGFDSIRQRNRILKRITTRRGRRNGTRRA